MIHALLQCSYSKGRDVYDLLWYLSDPDWPLPNFVWLKNALSQTGWAGAPIEEDTWRPAVLERLRAIPWPKIVADVSPFIERRESLGLLTLDDFERLLV